MAFIAGTLLGCWRKVRRRRRLHPTLRIEEYSSLSLNMIFAEEPKL
jgi:hypothetical protein